jgi:lysophospholipase L1-like esterase
MQTQAQAKGLPFVDIGAYLKTVASGISFNGVTYSTAFVTGGTFSLDGVHLTPRGYALVANYILDAINAKYGSTLSKLDINSYPGVRFP